MNDLGILRNAVERNPSLACFKGVPPTCVVLRLALDDPTDGDFSRYTCGTMRGSGSGSTTHYGFFSGYEDSDLIYDSD